MPAGPLKEGWLGPVPGLAKGWLEGAPSLDKGFLGSTGSCETAGKPRQHSEFSLLSWLLCSASTHLLVSAGFRYW